MIIQDKPLFSFGTLMDIDLLSCVTSVGKEKLVVKQAALAGYLQRNVIGEDFPVIIESEGSSTSGVVIYGLNQLAFERIFFYEGNEYYLAPVDVVDTENSIIHASVFLSTGVYQTGSESWSFDQWRQHEKADFIKRVDHYMKYFGKLSAADADQYW